jgi:LysR family transcriptional regulator, regulator for metE and metH
MKAIHAKIPARNLDRIHLQIVREVERQGSMTAAAATLHLTQSALSHAVRKLERALGAELWLREGRRLKVTEAGQYLLDVANHVLPQLEHAETSLRQMARCASAWNAIPATSGC